jgi:hypothetical protein
MSDMQQLNTTDSLEVRELTLSEIEAVNGGLINEIVNGIIAAVDIILTGHFEGNTYKTSKASVSF